MYENRGTRTRLRRRDMLRTLAKCDGEISETSRLIEIITLEELLGIWRHGSPG